MVNCSSVDVDIAYKLYCTCFANTCAFSITQLSLVIILRLIHIKLARKEKKINGTKVEQIAFICKRCKRSLSLSLSVVVSKLKENEPISAMNCKMFLFAVPVFFFLSLSIHQPRIWTLVLSKSNWVFAICSRTRSTWILYRFILSRVFFFELWNWIYFI